MKIWVLFFIFPLCLSAQRPSSIEITRWEKQAKNVNIIRDNWGIPHIYGKSDADAVFGLLYAQCEDDFRRVEMNYIEKLGRMSEVKGDASLYDDLLVRLVIDSSAAIADYQKSPAWLKKLMNAFADGINYYIYKHPEVTSALIRRFQPWYPLLWTDGSISSISTADIKKEEIKKFFPVNNDLAYSENKSPEEKSTGSNGFAFSPKITASGNAILYINPHVTFYFRHEVHVVSEEGLNVYGAVTWGQFFVYQGFNENGGWMHTSSGVDAADSYIESISEKNGKIFYEYDRKLKPVREKKIIIRSKTNLGPKLRTFNVMFTGHGPIMANRNGQYLSMKADNRILNGLIQCWMRNKTKSFAEYKKTMDLLGNISNNTVYADAKGNIAYWHGNRIPRRDLKYDWSKPVDGSVSATEWKGYHPLKEIVQCINPPNGWLQNCNSTPFTVAGENSPPAIYPSYMAPDPENFRGLNAVRVLQEENQYDLDKVIKAGYDTRLMAFELLIPALINEFETSNSKIDYSYLGDAINILNVWDYRCSENSVATTLSVYFGERLESLINKAGTTGFPHDVPRTKKIIEEINASELLGAFSDALDTLKKRFGSWNIAWGEVNRFQRISPGLDNKFDDTRLSIPVGFVSSAWGMLPSYKSRSFPGTNKRYGEYGNSFICAVEFVRNDSPGGEKIKAKALLAGGESGNPASPHFFDQGEIYSKGQFRDVLFYKEDIMKHAVRTYNPGQ